jgi:dienelactone hydrolase
MRILLAADIFGITGHLLEIAAGFGVAGNRCRTVGPYPASVCFADEDIAYAAFIEHGGVDSYTAKVLGHLADATGEPLVCIGFSAGAAALWRALADPVAEGVCLAVCLYGSQIRNAVAVDPRCPCLLVFPEEEPHFSVAELIGCLQHRPRIRCATVPWRHGYMNGLSRNFDREGYTRTLAWLQSLLNRPDRAGCDRDVFLSLVRDAT